LTKALNSAKKEMKKLKTDMLKLEKKHMEALERELILQKELDKSMLSSRSNGIL